MEGNKGSKKKLTFDQKRFLIELYMTCKFKTEHEAYSALAEKYLQY